jgi:hypothetical protein
MLSHPDTPTLGCFQPSGNEAGYGCVSASEEFLRRPSPELFTDMWKAWETRIRLSHYSRTL